MTPHGADSSPLVGLRCRTGEAIAELARLHSRDAQAASAMRAVRLSRYTLELFWLPALDDVLNAPPEASEWDDDDEVSSS